MNLLDPLMRGPELGSLCWSLYPLVTPQRAEIGTTYIKHIRIRAASAAPGGCLVEEHSQ